MSRIPDVSAAVFASRQGHALHGTLLSVARAEARARDAGASVDVTVILHDADTATREWLDEHCAYPRLDMHAACLGAARNAARDAVSGQYLAFLDGGDLWSGNFLEQALKHARRDDPRQVLRPAASLGFPDRYFYQNCYTTQFIPGPDDIDPCVLLDSNPYPATFLADRAVLEAIPFPHVDVARGWNDVDGWWCANLAGAGVHQVPVAGTAHYHPLASHGAPAPRGRLGPTWLERRPGQATGG